MTENPTGRGRRAFPTCGEAVGLVAVFLGVQIGVGAASMFVAGVMAALRKTGAPAAQMSPAAILAANVCAFAAVAFWAFAKTRGRWREILLGGRTGPASWLAALVLLPGVTLLVIEGSNLLQLVWPVPASMAKMMQEVTDLSAHPVLAVLLLVVLAPIGEEFLFRGIMLRGLLERMRPWRAVWLTTLFFAVMHLNPWQVPAAVGFGLLCGWVFLRTRSLSLCILLHLLNNAAALLVGRLPWRVAGLNDESGRAELLPWWFVAGGTVLLVLGGWLFARTTRDQLRPPPLPEAGQPSGLLVEQAGGEPPVAVDPQANGAARAP
jgi:membrane protease YdiL (CAAX protease family)